MQNIITVDIYESPLIVDSRNAVYMYFNDKIIHFTSPRLTANE